VRKAEFSGRKEEQRNQSTRWRGRGATGESQTVISANTKTECLTQRPQEQAGHNHSGNIDLQAEDPEIAGREHQSG
jgi:hypothetical protein